MAFNHYGRGGYGAPPPPRPAAAPMQQQAPRPQLSAAPMGQPRPGGMTQQAPAQNSWPRMQRRPQAQQAGGMMGGLLSDEESKTGIKNYNPDDGQTIGDSVDKYGLDDEEKKKDDGGIIGKFVGMLSDRHSKTQINRLEGANTALTRALSTRAEYPDTAAPSAGMQALGQQSAAPSHASFPDSAQQVAAQNQAMAPPQQNPFAVNMQRPNLDELDEAYKRLGQGG